MITTPWTRALSAFPPFLFSFASTPNALPITNELRSPAPARTLAVCATGLGGAGLVYGLVSVAGYTTYGALVASEVCHPTRIEMRRERIKMSEDPARGIIPTAPSMWHHPDRGIQHRAILLHWGGTLTIHLPYMAGAPLLSGELVPDRHSAHSADIRRSLLLPSRRLPDRHLLRQPSLEDLVRPAQNSHHRRRRHARRECVRARGPPSPLIVRSETVTSPDS